MPSLPENSGSRANKEIHESLEHLAIVFVRERTTFPRTIPPAVVFQGSTVVYHSTKSTALASAETPAFKQQDPYILLLLSQLLLRRYC
jgi:hypothetical protein